ncbi:hypothetical protein ACJX0J_011873, partial [Zea mays]
SIRAADQAIDEPDGRGVPTRGHDSWQINGQVADLLLVVLSLVLTFFYKIILHENMMENDSDSNRRVPKREKLITKKYLLLVCTLIIAQFVQKAREREILIRAFLIL